MNAPVAFERMPGVSAGVYAESDFRAIAKLVYNEAGILLAEGKSMMVYSRLAPLVRAAGVGTFAAYIALIDQDGAERHKAVGALTTNHTAFFRERHHFDHLEHEVRDRLVERALKGDEVRIWSSASSTGEEPWSIATVMLGTDREQGRRLAKSGLAILATDLADHALEKARAAQYPLQVIEPMPATLRKLWVEEAGGMATMREEPRALVRYRSLNLLGSWPIKRQFDVIFCRNVMIYFDTPTKERLIARFADQLVPGGFLYIGHSERVTGPAADRLTPVGNTIYRKGGA